MIIKIPKNKISKIDIINVQGGLTATQVYNRYNPDYLINLALYDMKTGTNITHLKDEQVTSGYLFSEYGIGIKEDKELVWTTKDDKSVRDYVSGSPILITNKKKNIDWGNKYSSSVNGVHYRSALGYNSNELVLYCSDTEKSLGGVVDDLLKDCDYAINLDGGGSCHLQNREKVYKKSVRSNASWLLVYLKPADLVLTIDKKDYRLKGYLKTSDVAPIIKNGRTMVPIYLIRELGFEVEWNASTKEVSITKMEG